MLRKVNTADAEAICKIYNYYVENTIITFETEPVSVDDMKHKIEETTANYDWIVYENEKGIVTGYAYLTLFRTRAAYQYTAETSVYVDVNETGKGIGNILYAELIKIFNQSGLHSLMGCIALPNEPSVKLHEKFGFIKAAHLTEVGKKFGKWIDVGYWELVKSSKT